MMAKITKGASFSGLVKYVMDDRKSANMIDSNGVRVRDLEAIAQSFEMQSELNRRVSKPVGHISLDFSQQDWKKLDDALMAKIAREYMMKMGILDTQYIVGRHHDKMHPHCHIIFNRVGNDGRTISDANDRVRSTKICRELTEKHGLYIANGKENVKRHIRIRLKLQPIKSEVCTPNRSIILRFTPAIYLVIGNRSSISIPLIRTALDSHSNQLISELIIKQKSLNVI